MIRCLSFNSVKMVNILHFRVRTTCKIAYLLYYIFLLSTHYYRKDYTVKVNFNIYIEIAFVK